MGVQEALADLGSTADEVAASLRYRGIKGSIDDPCGCPIANYIKSLGYGYASVGGGFAYAARDDIRLATECLPLPGPVQQFIRAFDNRAYPDLNE